MKPSHRQQAIFDCWENETCNILTRAVAGSGKTTTLMQLMQKSPKKTLFLAFNKSIQTEIQNRIIEKGISHARALTMHSLGFKALRENLKVQVESGKNYRLIKAFEKKFSKFYNNMLFKDKVALNTTLMDMGDVSRMFLTEDLDEIKAQMVIMGKTFYEDDRIQTIWEEFLNLRNSWYENQVILIDFLDMIYLPIVNNYRIPTSPTYLMIDEAQDLNLVQHAMIDRIIEQGTVEKWIAVGDSHQAIYGFAGAHEASFELFMEKDNVKDLPLDICYRCPSKIIQEANDVYNIMQGFKTEPGIVEDLDAEQVDKIKDNSLIICRNTGPLIQLFFYLLGKNRKAFLKGDDILGEMKKFLMIYKNKSLNQCYYELETELSKLYNKMTDSNSDQDKFRYFKHKENLDNYKLMSRHFEDKVVTVRQLLEYLEMLFTNKDQSDAIILCTIHKSKGLENKVVYILNEDLIPSKFATSKEALKQEKNLKYVGRTRASGAMYYLNISKEDFENVL